MDGALKKIPVAQLRRGMYLHKLAGSWLQNPFWRNAFVLDDPADLQAVRSCGIEEVWIDVSRGLDVAAVPAPTVAGAPAAASAPDAEGPLVAVPAPAVPAVSLREELDRARRICDSARGAVMSMFSEVRMGRTVDAAAALPLVEDIAASVARNPGALISIARLKTRDDYTYMHSVAVCALMVALARQIGLADPDIREAGLGGMMHDLGKALMPLDVLNKPGRLTEEEYGVMKRHPSEGWRLLDEGGSASALVRDVVLHHHERFDGSGYPDRLAGEAITLYARMGAICDVYDAVTSERPYKAPWDPAYAVRQMAQWKGHFDPRLFQAFIKSLGIYPVGSLVRLASDRLAVVAEQHPEALLHPIVVVFHSADTRRPITPVRLDLHAADTDDKITAVEDAAKWGFPSLDHL
ncbi:MAG: HD-GYP domain-containing protein, partial [Pseudomonadota bacterium]